MNTAEKTVMSEASFLPILPLKNMVALPKSVIPVVVGRELSIKAVDFAMKGQREVLVTAQRSSEVESPGMSDIFEHGTRAAILQVDRMHNGMLKIFIEGIARARIEQITQTEPFLGGMVLDEEPQPIDEKDPENIALWRRAFELCKEYINLNDKVSAEVLVEFKGPADLSNLADTIAVQMHLDLSERQLLLEIGNIKERAIKICSILQREIEIIKADRNIHKRVQSQVEKHQKDYYLTEQMRAIQRELGREDFAQEIAQLRKKAKKLGMPAEAAEKLEAEFKRLEQMQPTSPEASVSRNYVDWLMAVPWSGKSKDTVSMAQAEKTFDASHFGMKRPKERIIEFVAAKKFAGENLKRSPIICLAGPPGVGKTSLAQSIATVLGRPFVRISLGGVRDEAEIRGHRRTYIGAMPGKIVQAMKKVKVQNPVVLLDEIDKMATDFRGDPASALLEVLDPEQNKSFVDHFLEVDYDLSQVMFITTANMIDAIPYPLLDRMEIISLSGYTEHEKLEIAKRFLLPKLVKEYCLQDVSIELNDALLGKIIDEYTKEAGVRQLERVLGKVLRKAILQLLKGTKKVKVDKIAITDAMIETWLGVPPFKKDALALEPTIGVATGLAWTEVGGDVLEIEVSVLKGKGGLTMTGQLGEVMQESAQAAMSYIRTRAKDLGLKENFYADVDVHVHVPEGAIPKDGPSAGITMGTALTSAFTQVPVNRLVAMTGEVTLRGRVLQIGGLKEKLLAAARLGITKVLVPKSNEKDVTEILQELDPGVKIVFVQTMDEVLEHALVAKPHLSNGVKAQAKKEQKKPAKQKTAKKRAVKSKK